jgi:SAM-dependent methyltransferase
MPSSRCNHIPIILGIVRQLAPRSILDVGVGFGKWGHLFREYTDIVAAETDPARYARANWQVQIDGIEGHAPYLTPMHEYLYDTLHVGDMRTKIHEIGVYDLVFLGDVIEHVEKAEGMELLRACLVHACKAVLVTTPGRPAPQTAACDNKLEVHRSFWTPADFRSLARCVLKLDDNDTLVAVLLKDGVPAPVCAPPVRQATQPGGLWQRVVRRVRAGLSFATR